MSPIEQSSIDILKILEQDARLSPAQIATMVGRSEDEVRKEIAHLEDEGIIRRYKTVINWEKAGREQVYAFIDVRITPSRGVGFDDVAARIYRFPEVVTVYLVSGEYDLRVIITGNSLNEIAFFVSDRLATIDRVEATITHFVLKRYKEDSVILGETTEDNRLPVVP